MKAIYKIPIDPVGKIVDITEKSLEEQLKELQHYVGGYIETYTVGDVVIICNSDSKLIDGMQYNCTIDKEHFVGAILAVGANGDKFKDVPIDLEEWQKWIS